MKRAAAVVVAVGLAGAGVGMCSTSASAAPSGANLDLCVDSGTDYSAALSLSNVETGAVGPGGCIPWLGVNGKQTVTVIGYHGSSVFSLGHFVTDGSLQIVYAHGAVKSGTEHFTVTSY
jgi:hypothetical protein